MTPEMVIELARISLLAALTLASPLLGAALAVGLTVSILQTATGVQEQSLSFIPKAIAVSVTFFLLLPWLMGIAMTFTTHLFSQVGLLAR